MRNPTTASSLPLSPHSSLPPRTHSSAAIPVLVSPCCLWKELHSALLALRHRAPLLHIRCSASSRPLTSPSLGASPSPTSTWTTSSRTLLKSCLTRLFTKRCAANTALVPSTLPTLDDLKPSWNSNTMRETLLATAIALHAVWSRSPLYHL